MPYNAALPGLSEAILDALKALIVAALPDLNTQLASRAAPLSAITAVAGQIYIGDVDTLPAAATNPFWITIIGGGAANGRDTSIEIKQSGPGYNYSFYHNIFVYIHPDSLPGSSATVQAEARERLRSILQDWLVGDVFNNATNYVITLGSSQIKVAPARDTLDECCVVDVTKGLSRKSFGGSSQIHMLHLQHVGKIYGGY